MSTTNKGVPRAKRLRALVTHGQNCHYCNQPLLYDDTTIDHRLPLCRGGTSHSTNLVPCCVKCNTAKGPLTEQEFFAVKNDPKKRRALVTEISSKLNATVAVERRALAATMANRAVFGQNVARDGSTRKDERPTGSAAELPAPDGISAPWRPYWDARS